MLAGVCILLLARLWVAESPGDSSAAIDAARQRM
jgi:hypothetical protein